MSKAHTASALRVVVFFFNCSLRHVGSSFPVLPTVDFQSPNHCTARELPLVELFCSGRERDHTQVL